MSESAMAVGTNVIPPVYGGQAPAGGMLKSVTGA